MSYIRHFKSGTTQLCIPDPLPVGDDVISSQDFYDVEKSRPCIPSAGRYIQPNVGLHIKHNHASLVSTFCRERANHRQLEQTNKMSSLKRPNEMKPSYAPASSKIPRLTSLSGLSRRSELLTANDAVLKGTSSVSEMFYLLTAKGLATPDKHVRDVQAVGGSPNTSLITKPSVNLSCMPQATRPSCSDHNQVKQHIQSRPGFSISTSGQNAYKQWMHYDLGQFAYNRRVTSTRFTNPSNSTNVNSVLKAPPRYILEPLKQVAPVQSVRQMNNATYNINQNMTTSVVLCDSPISKAASGPIGSRMSNICIPIQNIQNYNDTDTRQLAAQQDNIYQQKTGAVRRISFEAECEMERLPSRDEPLYMNPDLHTYLQTSAEELEMESNDFEATDILRSSDHGNIFENVEEENMFELSDQLKVIKPYVISGWISNTYLLALMQKSNLVNEMFDNALDDIGDIRPEVVKNCRKTTSAILARDLVFRLFTLAELNGINLKKLSRNKMWAIRRCVKKHFPGFQKLDWKLKCIPQIKSSLQTLFRHRVKHVQDFWLSHSNDQPLDLTKSS